MSSELKVPRLLTAKELAVTLNVPALAHLRTRGRRESAAEHAHRKDNPFPRERRGAVDPRSDLWREGELSGCLSIVALPLASGYIRSMGNRTGIEWTNVTWNPVTGCTQVSAGCDNCYALTLAHRLLSAQYTRKRPERDTPENRLDPFAVRLWPERLAEPDGWKGRQRVFVNSMGDLFHAHIPDAFARSVFEVMLRTDQHTYQVLTKRPSRMARFLSRNADLFIDGIVPPHIWLGTSVEDSRVAHRVDHLRLVNASVRFLSCEPLIGPLDIDLEGIHWVIAGGESGIQHRPLDLDWVRSLRDDCVRVGVPFFFKQVGGRTPKAGGRTLDGRTWSEYPNVGKAVLLA